jgi:hypothetical protein
MGIGSFLHYGDTLKFAAEMSSVINGKLFCIIAYPIGLSRIRLFRSLFWLQTCAAKELILPGSYMKNGRIKQYGKKTETLQKIVFIISCII